MSKPSDKAPHVTQALDELAQLLFGRERTASIRADVCVQCGHPASTFTDDLSAREFRISGLCQECQNDIFGERSP